MSFGPVKNDEPHEYRSPQHIHRKISCSVTQGGTGPSNATASETCGFGKSYRLPVSVGPYDFL